MAISIDVREVAFLIRGGISLAPIMCGGVAWHGGVAAELALAQLVA